MSASTLLCVSGKHLSIMMYCIACTDVAFHAVCSCHIKVLLEYYHHVLCFQEALRDLQTFADSWKHFVGYVQIMLPYQLLRQVGNTLCFIKTRSLKLFIITLQKLV